MVLLFKAVKDSHFLRKYIWIIVYYVKYILVKISLFDQLVIFGTECKTTFGVQSFKCITHREKKNICVLTSEVFQGYQRFPTHLLTFHDKNTNVKFLLISSGGASYIRFVLVCFEHNILLINMQSVL